MKRVLAIWAMLLMPAACSRDTEPVAPTMTRTAAGPANQGDPNDDFHGQPHAPGEDGSHGRSGHINWKRTGPRTVEFEYVVAFRRGFFSNPVLGQNINLANVNVGTATLTPTFKVTFVDALNDWFEARATFSYTYPGTSMGPFNIVSQGCCRIGVSSTPGWANMNNPDHSYRYWGTVDLGHSGSPASTLPPIVTCPRNGQCTFFVPATAPEGLTVRWRLATPAEMGQANSTNPQPPLAPNAASVNAMTGLYSWNTTGAAVNPDPFRKSAYSTQVVMEGVDANGAVVTRSVIDFLILLANVAQNAPPAFQPPTPLDGSVFTVSPGGTLTFTLAANDANAPDVVTISGLGMPPGATLTGTPGNPATSAFTWTATTAQAGQSFAVSFSATDNHGLSGAQRSIVIRVPANQPPVARITGPGSASEGSQVSVNGSTSSDPDGDPLQYAWTLNGVPAGGNGPSFSFQAGDGPATVTVGLTVTDGKGGSSSASHTVTVNNVAPQGTFGAQSPVNEGTSFALSFSNVDDPSPADIAAFIQASFDCGSGSFGPFSTALSTSCTTVDNGTRAVRGRLRDKDGGETEYTGSVAVNNVAPTVDVGPDVNLVSGSTVTLSGTFSDPGVQDGPWTGTWSTGGSGSTSNMPGPFFTTKQFCAAGGHPVTLTVTDKDGGAGSDVLVVNVTRFDIQIDVNPETINLNGNDHGMITVRVSGSAGFDPALLDPSTLRLTNGSGPGTPLAQRNNGSYFFEQSGNGTVTLHFRRDAMIASGDLTSGTIRLYLLGTEGQCRQVSGFDDVRVIH